MKITSLSFVLLLAPAALVAQGGATVKSRATVSASAGAEERQEFKVPASFSAEGRAKLEAKFEEAREHHVPRKPMAHRVDEGKAKGASEESIIAAAAKVEANEEATERAMIKAGRKPTDAETERGEGAMERGVTEAQIEVLAKHTPSDRSLVVALDVLTKLAARGVPVAKALAQVQSKIDARESDEALASLVVNGNAHGATAGSHSDASGAPEGSAAGRTSATGAVNAAAGVTGSAKGVTGAVTGAVGGGVKVGKKP